MRVGDPTPQELKNVLDYDADSGILRWKERPSWMFKPGNRGREVVCKIWNKRFAGKVAGSISPQTGYVVVGLGRLINAHRVAWTIFNEKYPIGQIDHINGNPTDNRICNLRDVDYCANQQNAFMRSDNESGVTGVNISPCRRWWIARIQVGKRRIYLGRFSDIESAAKVREMAMLSYGFSPRHGEVRG